MLCLWWQHIHLSLLNILLLHFLSLRVHTIVPLYRMYRKLKESQEKKRLLMDSCWSQITKSNDGRKRFFRSFVGGFGSIKRHKKKLFSGLGQRERDKRLRLNFIGLLLKGNTYSFLYLCTNCIIGYIIGFPTSLNRC